MLREVLSLMPISRDNKSESCSMRLAVLLCGLQSSVVYFRGVLEPVGTDSQEPVLRLSSHSIFIKTVFEISSGGSVYTKEMGKVTNQGSLLPPEPVNHLPAHHCFMTLLASCLILLCLQFHLPKPFPSLFFFLTKIT